MTNTIFKNNTKIGNPYDFLDRNRHRKMVFYGRVSTEHEAQMAALENQIEWYDDQAKYHPNWEVLNKYIDEGITGTQAKKRPAFLQMIEDAKKGKFDLIVTREVCRFARNTVDTLVTTRELKNIGVEVYFVEDNIWTMDGDGELRLTIMATLAQEESRKTSERVKAGQHISRQQGMVYGRGNILGYNRKAKSTYTINPEQAETVRMIFDMYLQGEMGASKIANELTRLGRKNASGLVKWSPCVITRIVNNPTYMGYQAYGKSYSNNYLEQKRILNNDFSTYMLVKSDYEPIITEEEWYRCQEIKQRRVTKTIGVSTDGKKKQPNHGKNETKDLWATKLKCRCGASFRRNRWHKNNNAPWSYGYLCYNRLNNGSAQKRRDAGLDDTGYCDQTEIPDWKLEMMGKIIMEQVWRTRAEDIKLACEILQECYKPDSKSPRQNKSVMLANIEKLKSKKDILLDMRSDGEITKEEFLKKKEDIDKKISQLTAEYEKDDCPTESDEAGLELGKIESALNELIDFSKPVLPREIYQKFVSKVTPYSKTHYRWYLNLDGKGAQTADVKVNGRKSNATVAFCDEGEIPPVHFKEIIFFNILKQEIKNKKSFFVATLHRLQSQRRTNNQSLILGNPNF
jgi:site-specific DNA recombinase